MTHDGGKQEVISVDDLLVATGRSPNVEGMGLEAAGVDYDTNEGVKVGHMSTLKVKVSITGLVSAAGVAKEPTAAVNV